MARLTSVLMQYYAEYSLNDLYRIEIEATG